MPVVLAIVVLCLNVFAALPQRAAKPGPREMPETAVREAVRLLEAKDYEAFLTQYLPPDQLKSRAGTPEALKAMAQDFSTRVDRILPMLKAASTQKPAYDEAKTTATFEVIDASGAPSPLRLLKIGRYWYIGNK